PLGGGGGNATRHIALELAKMGHHPFVLTAAWRELPTAEHTGGVTIQRVPSMRQNAEQCSIPEMLAFTTSALLSAPGWARQWNVDAALVFFTLPCGPVGALLKRLLKIPYCISLQGGDVPGFDPQSLRHYHTASGPVIRALWRDANAVVANSEGLADLAQRFDARTKIGVIPAGVDLERFSSKQTYGERKPVELLFTGRLVKQKGLDVFFAALGSLPPSLSWKLTLVGDGPERRALKAQAARLNIAERIAFTGWTNRDALPDIYRRADVFVLPSR
ncbi:MAG: glycosyltransferase, partial [Rhodospirillaceae bacterium]